MKLKTLIRGLPVKVMGSKECEILGLSLDSRKAAPKDLFIAQKGCQQDGVFFLEDAVSAGASALVTPFYNPFLKIPQVISEDPASLAPILASRFYQEPSKELWIAGVTGSKGKTTTCYLIHHLLHALQLSPGLLSTVEWVVGKRRLPSSLTTQDTVSNQKLLREMVDFGSKAAVLEVSSHGLAQKRVEEIAFQVALVTNLFSDHLDYHRSLQNYAEEKRKLFQMAPFAIYNADSPWTEFMKGKGEFLTFGIDCPAHIVAKEIRLEKEGTFFRIQDEPFFSPLTGKFNLSNLLGAISVGVHLGVSLAQLSSIFKEIPIIPGRLERVSNQEGIELFVDYAHTGEALSRVLSSLKEVTSKRLFVVFGCGGDRDPAR
ncbi:MAG: UDP-N-acetylmuramoyl-L-alanyl-D-glutamate--2,6-diaminopimelate ligase, partial [Chlamydiia bacterium]|nr:UDP-N-acetylmuramoyl-L-alanyl-D-glutamate--2,6-diaminopimelate ligase [Chlamydiia bacterium]